MTKEELIAILLKDTDDVEKDHADSDEALLDFINDEEIRKAFRTNRKWYA